MPYDSLRKIYYKYPEKHQDIYTERFNAPFTKHFEIDIRQFNRACSFPAFLCYTEEMLAISERITDEHARLCDLIKDMPLTAINQFTISEMINEINSTNQIEGVQSTRKEIADALKTQYEQKHITRFWSVVNKYQKIINREYIDFSTPEAVRKFYDEFILEEVIALNPDNAPDGKIFRKSSVSIGEGKDRHRGLFPEDKIISAMSSALNILNNESMPLFIRIALFHYFFGYIHPFYDGNGRTSRFIASYYLAKRLIPIVSLRLSINIKRHRLKYYSLFEDTTSEYNRGDLSYFVTEFLGLILTVVADVRENLCKRRSRIKRYEGVLESRLNACNITDKLTREIYFLLLQPVLFGHDGVTVDEITTKTKKSRNTIDSRLAQIPPRHIIKITGIRPYRYRLNSLFLKSKEEDSMMKSET